MIVRHAVSLSWFRFRLEQQANNLSYKFMTKGTLLFTRSDVAALLTIDEYIASIEHAFKLYGEGKTNPPGILGVHSRSGGFHIKAGVLDLEQSFFAAKINANFPQQSADVGIRDGFPLKRSRKSARLRLSLLLISIRIRLRSLQKRCLRS